MIPEDVRTLSYDILRHRISLTYEAEAEIYQQRYHNSNFKFG